MIKSRKYVWGIFTIILSTIAGIQFYPIDRNNPSIRRDISQVYEISETTQRLLKSYCYDCHSNETRWPWYGYVAPISWMISKDVKEGRDALNLSEWDEDQEISFWEATDKIETNEMPLRFYFPQPTLEERTELVEGIEECCY
jgi:hypothetical protein